MLPPRGSQRQTDHLLPPFLRAHLSASWTLPFPVACWAQWVLSLRAVLNRGCFLNTDHTSEVCDKVPEAQGRSNLETNGGALGWANNWVKLSQGLTFQNYVKPSVSPAVVSLRPRGQRACMAMSSALKMNKCRHFSHVSHKSRSLKLKE